MTGNGEVTKRRVREGVGEFPVDCPLEDCAVRVHYTARVAGTDTVRLHWLSTAVLLRSVPNFPPPRPVYVHRLCDIINVVEVETPSLLVRSFFVPCCCYICSPVQRLQCS